MVVNCVAERRPDVVDQQPDRTRQLNVELVQSLGQAASQVRDDHQEEEDPDDDGAAAGR